MIETKVDYHLFQVFAGADKNIISLGGFFFIIW